MKSKEIFLKAVRERGGKEAVEIDGQKFLIIMVEDKDHVEVDAADWYIIEGARVDCVEGTMRVYPKRGDSKVCYEYETHRIWSVGKEDK